MELTGPVTLVDFLPFLQARQLVWFPVCFPANQAHSEKGSTLKGKNLLPLFAPKGSKFFPFRVDPFSEGMQKQFDKVIYPDKVSS